VARPERVSAGNDPRETSRNQVVSVIRSAGQIARIDIAQETGVSPATVTAITAELIRAGLVEEVAPEVAQVAAGRGRPRVSLRVHGAAHILAGIKFSSATISTILIDFDGTTLSEHVAQRGETLAGSIDRADRRHAWRGRRGNRPDNRRSLRSRPWARG